MKQKRELSLTEGSVTKTLLRFTVPFLLANLLQALYGLVDLMVVGQFADPANMAAVSLGSLVFTVVMMLVIGLSVSGTVLIGQFLGAGRPDDARDVTATMFTLFPLIGLGMTAAFFFLAAPVLRLLNTPADAFEPALQYVWVCTGGVVFTTGYNCLSAALRGVGDSKTPLYFVLVACIFNIIGDLALVGGLHLGALGAGIATTAGQALSMILGIIYLRKRDFLFDFKLRSFHITGEKARKLLRLGIPLALQEALVMLSFLIIESVITVMGVAAVAAAGVCERLFMIAVIPCIAFSSSIAAMGAQNLGAGKPERVRKCLKTGVLFAFFISLIFLAWGELAPESVARLFTDDAEVAAQAALYMKFYCVDFVLCSIIFPINGLLNAAGRTRFTLINNIVSTFIVRVPLALLISRLVPGATLLHIGIALPAASVVQLISAFLYYKKGSWRKNIILGD